ncbi:Ubiquitin recognition factor in ER-associated degradation protein 1 [Linum grandiflorum]
MEESTDRTSPESPVYSPEKMSKPVSEEAANPEPVPAKEAETETEDTMEESSDRTSLESPAPQREKMSKPVSEEAANPEAIPAKETETETEDAVEESSDRTSPELPVYSPEKISKPVSEEAANPEAIPAKEAETETEDAVEESSDRISPESPVPPLENMPKPVSEEAANPAKEAETETEDSEEGGNSETSDYPCSSKIPTADRNSPESPVLPPQKMSEAVSEEAETESEESEEEHYSRYDSDDSWERAGTIFERCYACRPLPGDNSKEYLEQGGQIIMPESALMKLLDNGVSYPILFSIKNESNSDSKESHCGVSEFTAEEGTVMMPKWMMQNLNLEPGEIVKLKNVDTGLEKCTFAKLQPHSVEFWAIRDMKTALEQILSANFFCLTTGDTLQLKYQSKKFYVDVLETRPDPAVCILDADFEVDFAAPLDYKEPKVVEEEEEEGPVRDRSVFVPFSGVGRRLNGECAMVEEKGATEEVEKKMTMKKKKEEQFQPFTGKSYTLAG